MKKFSHIFAIAISLVFILLCNESCIVLNYAVKPNKRGKDLMGSYTFMYENYPYLESWIDSLNREQALKDTFIYAPDGAKLHAYYIHAPNRTQKTAVILHGYTDNAIRMFMIGHLYNYELGYNVLIPDLRWAGQSDGTHIQMGWLDRLDVLRWMDVANQIYGGATQMVLHGISMGAATTMMVSGEQQPEYVKCFIEDCGYTSVWDEFKHELKKRFNSPPFPVLHLTNWVCGKKYGWTFKEASAIRQIENSYLPMLFIHGEKDDFVPTWMVYELYQAKPAPKELWIVPDAAHAVSYKNHREEYIQTVRHFVGKYIN